jgi:hypothetical protein
MPVPHRSAGPERCPPWRGRSSPSEDSGSPSQRLAGPGGSDGPPVVFLAGAEGLWEIFETGTVQLLPLGKGDIAPIKNLMEKYRDLPMDLADAALVRVAEREGLRQVLTLDQRDFNVYRLPRKGRFTLLP